MWALKPLILCLGFGALGACTTTNKHTSPPTDAPIAAPEPVGPSEPAPVIPPVDVDPAPVPILAPEPDPIPLPVPTTPEVPPAEIQPPSTAPLSYGFSKLSFWQGADTLAALTAFRRTCAAWAKKPEGDWLNPRLPRYGQYKDWRDVCAKAPNETADKHMAALYFQKNFEPVQLGGKGLLTAYYSPQIDVRRRADDEFYEPILALPDTAEVQNLPRKDINVHTSKVLAYGRPIDVFFLQIQGSGQIKFSDGTIYRAAYDGHNSKEYKSIGSVLIARGHMTKDTASKQAIEDWMQAVGREKTRALINENPRYVFFKTEYVVEGEGPKGAAGLALTSMGSLAIDPQYHPYGALIWLEGKFPARAGDYIGEDGGRLVVTQDTGGAIKGSLRGDVFFGIGDEAGARAGVMKHQATWTVFLPKALAFAGALVS